VLILTFCEEDIQCIVLILTIVWIRNFLSIVCISLPSFLDSTAVKLVKILVDVEGGHFSHWLLVTPILCLVGFKYEQGSKVEFLMTLLWWELLNGRCSNFFHIHCNLLQDIFLGVLTFPFFIARVLLWFITCESLATPLKLVVTTMLQRFLVDVNLV
jgi:hypothetical protein